MARRPAARLVVAFALLTTAASPEAAEPSAEELAARAVTGIERAAAFYREQLSVQGSYVWEYAADLSERRGEAVVTHTQGWVEPPGTPTVGLAFLDAYEATGVPYLLDAAAVAARALVHTQLISGGWYAMIEFDPSARDAWCYREVVADPKDCRSRKGNSERNATVVDDDISQRALELLMRVDHALGGSDDAIGDALNYALGQFMHAQYDNGAWPVRFDRGVKRELAWSAWRARFPEAWPHTYQEISDPVFYSTNDNLVGDMIRVFLVAHRLYDREEYLATAIRAGEFLLAAQLPPPQPGWAQQYNRDLEPIWGRRFEPPAVAGWETKQAIEALLELHLHTGERRYLDAAGAAVDWLRQVPIDATQWSRFYELETNRPLFVTADGEIAYDETDVRRGYSFSGTYDIPRVIAWYERIAADGREAFLASLDDPAVVAPRMAALMPEVEMILQQLDPAGRWLDDDRIRSNRFATNLTTLAEFVALVGDKPRSSFTYLLD